MSIQQLKSEAEALSDAERRELIAYLITRGPARPARSMTGKARSADFLEWAARPRPHVGLCDVGRDFIYED